MISTNLLKILFILFIAFAIGEIIFTVQRYGKDIFKSKPGSCKILEEKFCSQTRIARTKDIIYIGINLPPGTPIYAPVDGRVSVPTKINQPSPFQGFTVGMNDSNDPTVNYSFRGDVQFSSNLSGVTKAGIIIGTVTNTGAKSFDIYNFVIGIEKPDLSLKRYVSVENRYKILFPKLKL